VNIILPLYESLHLQTNAITILYLKDLDNVFAINSILGLESGVVLSSEHNNLELTKPFLFQLKEFVELDTSVQKLTELNDLEALEEELAVESCFLSWSIAKHYIKKYGQQQEFAINHYQ
ncbi:21500_t:CDS:2, partial [Cetraspora pellucida]